MYVQIFKVQNILKRETLAVPFVDKGSVFSSEITCPTFSPGEFKVALAVITYYKSMGQDAESVFCQRAVQHVA